MVSDILDCYYNPEEDEIFLSNIGEHENLNKDEIKVYKICKMQENIVLLT